MVMVYTVHVIDHSFCAEFKIFIESLKCFHSCCVTSKYVDTIKMTTIQDRFMLTTSYKFKNK